MSSQKSEKDDVYQSKIKYTNVCLIFLLVWILLGLAGFVKSLMCFGNKGTNFDKTMGMIIASIFGPFYWIYYSSNNNYCLRN